MDPLLGRDTYIIPNVTNYRDNNTAGSRVSDFYYIVEMITIIIAGVRVYYVGKHGKRRQSVYDGPRRVV